MSVIFAKSKPNWKILNHINKEFRNHEKTSVKICPFRRQYFPKLCASKIIALLVLLVLADCFMKFGIACRLILPSFGRF